MPVHAPRRAAGRWGGFLLIRRRSMDDGGVFPHLACFTKTARA